MRFAIVEPRLFLPLRLFKQAEAVFEIFKMTRTSACWADQGEGDVCSAEAKMLGSLITEGGDFKSRHMARRSLKANADYRWRVRIGLADLVHGVGSW